MNDEQKYLFDLQGYLVLEQVVPAAVISAANAALDRYESMPESEYPSPLQLGQERTPENLYISNIIEGDDAFLPPTWMLRITPRIRQMLEINFLVFPV